MSLETKMTARVCLVALIVGAAGVWLGSPQRREPKSPSLTMSSQVNASSLPLVLGGFRGIAAAMAWLRVQLAWERGDEPAVVRWSSLATALDPQVLAYWINGARMLAYDFADARHRDAEKRGVTTQALRERIDREQARIALERLAEGFRHHPDDPRLLIEMGNIHLHRRNDMEAAAGCYGRAAAHPASPLYAQRIQAGLLWRLGRRAEGLEVLRKHHQRLVQAEAGSVDPELIVAVARRTDVWGRELEP